MGGTLTVNALNGIATFTDLTVNKTGGGYAITAAGDNLTATSGAFAVNDDQLAITSAPPASAVAGQVFGLTVQAESASGAVDTAFNGEIDLALDATTAGPDVHLGGVVSLLAVNGVASFSGLNLTTPGAYKITATATDAAPADSQLFQVSAAATQLLVTAAPTSATAGAPFEVDVAAVDADKNLDDSFTGNVTLSIGANPGGSTLAGTTTVAAVNGVATFTGLSLSGTGAGYTLTAAAAGLSSATTPALNVTPAGQATQLVVTTQPAVSATAGATLSFVVKAEDGFGTVDTSFTGAVTVSNPNATLGGTLTVNAVAGVATFSSVQIDTAGTPALVVSGGALTGTTNAITVNPAAATQLVLAGPSQNPLAGGTFGFDVAAADSFGNIDPNFTGSITIALSANPGNSALGGTLTVNAVNGDATFPDLSLNNTGTGYTLRATTGGLSAGTSQPFDVTADQLVVTADVRQTVPQLATIDVAVSAENESGGVDASFTGPVTVSLVDQGTGSGTTPTLGGTLTVNAVAGVATFSDLTVDQPGDYSLTFTTGGLGQASSSTFTVTPRVATTITLSAASASVAFGTSDAFTAKVSSADGGMTGAGTVTLYSQGVKLQTVTVGNDGTATITASDPHSGARRITATFDGNSNFLPGTSNGVDVTVGPQSSVTPSLKRFVFPATAVAGQTIRTNLPVVLTNAGSALKGKFAVQLLLDTSSTPDANAVQVAQLTPRLSIASGRSTIVHFNLRSLSAAIAPGTYHFIARIADPNGGGNIGASTSTVIVQAPVVSLGATAGPVEPSTIQLNKPGVATVLVKDVGNVDAVGTLQVVLSPSSDGTTPVAGVTLGSIHPKVHLRHGARASSFAVRFKVTSALPAAVYQQYFSITLGNVLTTAVGSAFSAA